MATTRLIKVEPQRDSERTRLYFQTMVEPIPVMSCYEVPTSEARRLVENWELADQPPVRVSDRPGVGFELEMLAEVEPHQAMRDDFVRVSFEMTRRVARGEPVDDMMLYLVNVVAMLRQQGEVIH